MLRAGRRVSCVVAAGLRTPDMCEGVSGVLLGVHVCVLVVMVCYVTGVDEGYHTTCLLPVHGCVPHLFTS